MVAEILKLGGGPVVSLLTSLCNHVFREEKFPEDWCKGLIFPLFKGGRGEKLDPLNYRGITLLSIVGKVFASVLNARVTKWCEHQKILSEAQCGFRKGRSTLDHIFVLAEVIKSRLPDHTFACFLDIKAAYDRVFRDGLWYKLHELGMKGKLWRVLMALYRNVQSCVMIGDVRSDFFRPENGLRQGCILSPILFAIFINDLAHEIEILDIGVELGKDIKISLLLFADDIVLLSTSKGRIQQMVNVAFAYSLKWRYTYNVNKCELLICGTDGEDCVGGASETASETSSEISSSCTCHYGHITLNGTPIKNSKNVKYLDCQVSFQNHKIRVASKARATLAMVCGIGLGKLSVAAAVNLWSSLIRSQLEYGCEIWGDEEAWLEGEYIQHEMARRILNCGVRTPIAAMMGDLGWMRLVARRDLQRLMFWGKLVKMSNYRLTKRVYLQRKRDFVRCRSILNWCSHTHSLLSSLDLMEYWNDEHLIQDLDDWRKEVSGKIFEREQRLWRNECILKPKLRTYRTFKTELKLESYLGYGSFLSRSVFFSIRSSSCRLRIETGRWKRPKEDEKDRLCEVCGEQGKVETEVHFVTECNRYQELRMFLYSEILFLSGGALNLFQEKDEEKIFRLIISESWGDKDQKQNISKACVKFVYLAMKKRSKLMHDRLV